METEHQRVLQSLKSRPQHEVEYFESLFARSKDGDATISGGAAVSFFKLSNLSTVSDRTFFLLFHVSNNSEKFGVYLASTSRNI